MLDMVDIQDFNWWCTNEFFQVICRMSNLTVHWEAYIQSYMKGSSGSYLLTLHFSWPQTNPSDLPVSFKHLLCLGANKLPPFHLNLLKLLSLLSRACLEFLSSLPAAESFSDPLCFESWNMYCPLYSTVVSLWTYRIKNDDSYMFLSIWYHINLILDYFDELTYDFNMMSFTGLMEGSLAKGLSSVLLTSLGSSCYLCLNLHLNYTMTKLDLLMVTSYLVQHLELMPSDLEGQKHVSGVFCLSCNIPSISYIDLNFPVAMGESRSRLLSWLGFCQLLAYKSLSFVLCKTLIFAMGGFLPP